MNIKQNVSLGQYSTMRLGGNAANFVEVTSRSELKEAVSWAKQSKMPIIVIGGGSNIIWRDEGFEGLVIANQIMGYDDYSEDARSHYVTVGAGEPWDSVVERTVNAGLTGIECLSLIPGTAGATPIQNVGAYGQEISSVLTSLEVYDLETDSFINLPNESCGFEYRKSKFQTDYRGKYIITAITLHLQSENPKPPFYEPVQKYLDDQNNSSLVTPPAIRGAVISIRQSKLPNPIEVANCGSFFANPIISTIDLNKLRQDYPTLPCWPLEDGRVKIPAAWLIEQAGFKDFHDEATGMATWAKQPLVLVNENAKSTADLLTFRQKLVETVQSKFNITLDQEPELLP